LTATPVAALSHGGRSLTEIAFHPGGGHLLGITADERFFAWDLRAEHPIPWAHGEETAAFAAWTPDGRALVTASARGDVTIRAFPDGEIPQRVSYGGAIQSMALSPIGGSLALGGKRFRVWDNRWDMQTGELVNTMLLRDGTGRRAYGTFKREAPFPHPFVMLIGSSARASAETVILY
jgi:WD40 repeat protein